MNHRKCRRAPLTQAKILAWADAHFRRTGKWPLNVSGAVVGMPHETWEGINQALRGGWRGLPGGSTLAQLLARERAVPNRRGRPRLTLRQIRNWAEAHFKRTGKWPSRYAGPVWGELGESWYAINSALRFGLRGLAGGTSLAKVLIHAGCKRDRRALPPFNLEQIVHWIAAYHQRTKRWPSKESGPITDAPGETWLAVDLAMYQGWRGQGGGVSLAYVVRLYRNILLRAHWEDGLCDGKNRFASPAQLVAVLVARRIKRRQQRLQEQEEANRKKERPLDRLNDIRPRLKGVY